MCQRSSYTEMADFLGLTFTEEDVEAVLAAAMTLEEDINTNTATDPVDLAHLKSLKRERIKTLLHGTILSGYLKSNAAPQGLIVRNEPFIFQKDLAFKKDWSLVSWHCTRDWIILIIKTATRLANDLKEEIETIEIRIRSNQSLSDLKKRLEELNKEMSNFESSLKTSKVNKLKRDVAAFSLEKVYPYTHRDYVAPKGQRPFGDSDLSDTSTVSDSSNSSGEDSGARQFRRPRGRARGRMWHDYSSVPFYPQYPYMPPYMPPPGQWGPYQGPMQYPQGPRPFLGFGQDRPRGRWKDNQRPQVQWTEDREEGKQQGHNMDTRSKTARLAEPRAGTSKNGV